MTKGGLLKNISISLTIISFLFCFGCQRQIIDLSKNINSSTSNLLPRNIALQFIKNHVADAYDEEILLEYHRINPYSSKSYGDTHTKRYYNYKGLKVYFSEVFSKSIAGSKNYLIIGLYHPAQDDDDFLRIGREIRFTPENYDKAKKIYISLLSIGCIPSN